jgi:DNA-binding response OmpR family regulator
MPGTVLVVDDEQDIVDVVRAYLERDGYTVHVARDGRSALLDVERISPEVVILDVMLPHRDGLDVCREIRRTRNVPILMLSARGEDSDKIVGLEVGADDYLTKPFSPKELVARVRAMFRRLRMAPDEGVMLRRGLRIDTMSMRADVEGGQALPLTPLEFALLRALAAAPGRALSRQELLDKAWGDDFVGDERTVDVHIRHLRAKLQQAAPGPQYITSVWGVGYKFEA